MSFGSAGALLWGLLAVPIVVLYILKVRLRRVPVSTSLFWDQVFVENRPRSIWQQLRHLLSLLLQLLFVLLLTLAVADPYMSRELVTARRLVLVVDHSASMNATDGDPTRLDAAKDKALRLIRSLRWYDEMAIIAAGATPRVVCGLNDHQKTLVTAIDGIASTDSPTTVSRAVELARRIVAEEENAQIVVLTDGCFDAAKDLTDDNSVQLVLIGDATPNVGITRLQPRQSLVDAIGFEVLIEVVNHSTESATRRLELSLNGNLVDVLPIELAAGESFRHVLQYTTAEGGELVAELQEGDALAADNRAVALIPRRAGRRVYLIGSGNLFLEGVLNSIPFVDLIVTDEMPAALLEESIVVMHQQRPEPDSGVPAPMPIELPACNVLVIHPSTSTPYWDLAEELQDPLVAAQKEDSPLLRHVNLLNLVLPGVQEIEIKTQHKVLARSLTDSPLFAAIDRQAGKLLVLNVDLNKADLPLRTAFPILVTNVVSWFAGQSGDLRPAHQTGDVLQMELAGQTRQSEPARFIVRNPAGQVTELPAGAEVTSFGPVDQCGVWSVRASARRETAAETETPSAFTEFAVNLANEQESNLARAASLRSDKVVATLFGGRPIWFYLALAGLVLTTLEWYLYQRRWIG